MNKLPTWATQLGQAWTRLPLLHTHDSSKLSHVSGYALVVWFGEDLTQISRHLNHLRDLVEAPFLILGVLGHSFLQPPATPSAIPAATVTALRIVHQLASRLAFHVPPLLGWTTVYPRSLLLLPSWRLSLPKL